MCLKIKRIEDKKSILKKAEKSATYLLETIENTDLCRYVYREDYVGLKKIKEAVVQMLKKENKRS